MIFPNCDINFRSSSIMSYICYLCCSCFIFSSQTELIESGLEQMRTGNGLGNNEILNGARRVAVPDRYRRASNYWWRTSVGEPWALVSSVDGATNTEDSAVGEPRCRRSPGSACRRQGRVLARNSAGIACPACVRRMASWTRKRLPEQRSLSEIFRHNVPRKEKTIKNLS